MKQQVETRDATPNKNIYRSIIADYDAETALCELVDNAIDIWTNKEESFKLEISVSIDTQQQTIRISDNAGGIRKEELDHIMGPGKSSSNPDAAIIGIFGVGSKRAVVALSELIVIKSRFKSQQTHSVEITEDWLADPRWDFPVYQVTNISPNTTEIEMTKLRDSLDGTDIVNIQNHFSAVYGKLLGKKNIRLSVNGRQIKPILFDNRWSYNPTVPPKSFNSTVLMEGQRIDYTVTGGLITEGGDSGYGEYGVYVYCNDRLIARALKTFDVGFTKGKVGVPHGSISLARLIIEIVGPAKLMPWNSSKSGIDSKHKLFLLTRNAIIEVIKHYASASRTLFPLRDSQIKPFTTGSLKLERIESVAQIEKSHLPPIPKTKKAPLDQTKSLNADLASSDPWVVGLYESVIAAEHILSKNYETKNRFSLILLDSSIEIAFKDYLTHKVTQQHYNNAHLATLFEKRHKVHAEVKRHCGNLLKADDWTQLEYYYSLRCDLIHKKTSATLPDSEIKKFTKLAKRIHYKLLDVRYPRN